MRKIISVVALFFITAGFLSAKWWIFGKSKDEVSIKYMTVNSLSFDETTKKIKLFKENLKDDKVIIKGKASAGKGAVVGSVKVTLDGKASWHDAKFSENGDFEFSFTPELNKIYKFYIEITNTVGKTNNIEDTYREIEVVSENIKVKVKEILDEVFGAYSNKSLSKFMSYVSDDFAGDRDFLELAVKKDFNALNNIKINYSINNIASGAKGIAVSITYNRSIMSSKSGLITTDNGMTEMVLKYSGEKLKIYSMKKPLLFGLSDADNIATGQTPGQSEGIVISDGEVGGSVQIINISCSGINPYLRPLYYFTTGEKGCHPHDDVVNSGQIGEFIIYDNQVELQHNGQMKEFNKNIESLTPSEVTNLTGYTQPVYFIPGLSKSYGIYMPSTDEFFAFQMISMPASSGVQNTSFKVRKF